MRPLSTELLGLIATITFTLLATVFRMGVRRERVDNIKHGLTLEVRNLRDNNSQRFDRIELRLSSIEGQLAAIQDRRAGDERWQGGVESTLDAQEQRLAQVERAVVIAAPRVAT